MEIRIPLGAPVSATPPVVPPVKLRGGPPRAGRILVVDDEPLVLRLLVSTLERGGYEVRAADGLAAALERAGEPGDIDLVVTDVVMPGGSGVDLANTLWRSRHDLGVVFVSGYTGSSVDSELLARPNVRFLGKPLAPRELLDLVGELVA